MEYAIKRIDTLEDDVWYSPALEDAKEMVLAWAEVLNTFGIHKYILVERTIGDTEWEEVQ